MNLKHNKSNTPEYKTWDCMKSRCTNPNDKRFKYYGGRGIKVCEEWMSSFSLFYDHIGPKPTEKHTLDRINGNLGYEPGNVRWATISEQNNNSRNNHNITFNGKTQNIQRWSEDLCVARDIIYDRIIRSGWSIEKALSTPVRHKKSSQSQAPKSSKSSPP